MKPARKRLPTRVGVKRGFTISDIATLIPEPVSPPMWVIEHEGKLEDKPKSQEIYYWTSEHKALDVIRETNGRWLNREVRKLTIQELNKYGASRFLLLEGTEKDMATKKTSTALLVEVFEDYEKRRFAISTRAANEAEFLSELAQVLSQPWTGDWNTRLNEFLPLAVDMCCKFRGYKADSVFERRELVAGDLEMPKQGKPNA